MRILLLFCFSLLAFSLSAQSTVERVAKAINQNDLFNLQREYELAKDVLPEGIRAIAQVKLGLNFNHLQVDQQLFNSIKSAGKDLGMEHFMNLGFLVSWYLHRQNRNIEAVENLDRMMLVCKDRPEYLKVLKLQRKQYEKYSSYSLYRLERPQEDVRIPLQVDPLGEGGLGFTFAGKVNDSLLKFTFDTGATTNVISREIADKYHFTLLYDTMNFAGLGHVPNEMVLVDSINLGGFVVYNVPFCVMDLKSGNTKADQYLERSGVIFGLPLLNVVKEVQLDFKEKELIFPSQLTPKSLSYSNLYWEPGGYMVMEAIHLGKQMLFLLDSGSGCSTLSSRYYHENRERFQAIGQIDTIGFAGIGGVVPTAYYWEPDFSIEVGGKGAFAQRVMVAENSYFKHFTLDCGVFGADLFLIFSKVILNMEDMFMQVETK